MSKKQMRGNSSLNYKPSAELPALQKIKVTWDLKKLYYTSEKDKRIEIDIKKTERTYSNFAKKWRNKSFTKNAGSLLVALTDFEKLSGMPEASRPGRYFGLRLALNAKDTIAQKHQALLSKRLRKVSDNVLFFILEIGKISKKEQLSLLSNPKLKHFKYYLEQVFLNAKHTLSEPEEKIMSLKSSQSYGRWVNATGEIVSNRSVIWKGNSVPIPEAFETIDILNPRDKKKLWSLLMTEMEKIGEFAEHEFNAIITDVRTEEDLRKYDKPYSATALNYEDTEKNIENLVSAVSSKGFELSRKFYKLKAKYHNVKKLHYTQKYESIGSSLEISFGESVTICRDVFYGVNKIYGKIFDSMLKNGQIDVYPKIGKSGGAFMSDSTGHPVHVFLNHKSNFKSLETLAHEMGHAIHAHRSALQSPFYDGHSIITAETASTLFENLLFDAVYSQSKEKNKIVLLHDRITRDIATIQRQIAFFNCELEIHNTISKQGAMTNKELSECMYRHLKSYLGPAVDVQETDGYSYVNIPHLRYGFYVYTYSFGILMSTLMANKYKDDSKYSKNIDMFLCSGSSDTVANIFKSIGINTTKENTFTKALQNHESDIQKFELFVKKKK